MRGRRPEKLTIARRDQKILHAAAHNGSLPWFQVQRAKIVLAIAAEDVNGLSPTAWNVMSPRFGVFVNGIARMAWRVYSPTVGRAIRDVRSKSPPCNGHKSWYSPVWNRLPRGYISHTGLARTSPAK